MDYRVQSPLALWSVTILQRRPVLVPREGLQTQIVRMQRRQELVPRKGVQVLIASIPQQQPQQLDPTTSHLDRSIFAWPIAMMNGKRPKFVGWVSGPALDDRFDGPGARAASAPCRLGDPQTVTSWAPMHCPPPRSARRPGGRQSRSRVLAAPRVGIAS